ncbi:MAG: type II toxin-antitoxin system RelE/ParE family toxin [Allorhizobium sp.]
MLLIFSPRAVVDIDKIYDFTADTWGVAQAERYVWQIRQACNALIRAEQRGRRIDRVRPGYFSLQSGSHFIIYKHGGASLTVVRILHQRMNIGAHL